MLRSRIALASLITLAAASAAGSVFFSNTREYRARLEAERKLIASVQRNDELELNLTSAFLDKEEVRIRLTDTENRLYKLNGRLGLLHEELKRNREIAQHARADYARALRQKRHLAVQLRKRDRQIKQIRATLLDAKRGAGSVDLGSVVMTAAPRPPLVVQRQFDVEEILPEVEGEVISVNDEFDFVVVNLGEQDGIRKGARFWVYRGGKRIGEARVEMVRERLSAATVSASGIKVEAGDKARFQSI